MEKKKEKWLIAVNLRGNQIYIERDSMKEVETFFREEHEHSSYNIDNYIVYPPYSNLTATELHNYSITAHKPRRIRDDD